MAYGNSANELLHSIRFGLHCRPGDARVSKQTDVTTEYLFISGTQGVALVHIPNTSGRFCLRFLILTLSRRRYDPTIENVHHKTIRFRKVHFATDIVDTAGMVSMRTYAKHKLPWGLLYKFTTFVPSHLSLYCSTGRIFSSIPKRIGRCARICPCILHNVSRDFRTD